MWLGKLEAALPLFGHRNWIVVADSAYPNQSSPGIDTIAAAADHLEVIEAVLTRIAAAGHVRATIYTDRELSAVAEEDAPGVSAFRQELAQRFAGLDHSSLPHEDIITRLDEASRLFRVLIVKTTMRIPYTSVFIQLGCGYWTEEAEKRLRASVAAASVE
jgi:hypothetical protein